MKTESTLQIEKILMQKTIFDRTFGCPEVTIGWYGKHRVDFLETDTKGIIRCYEIKVSKSDFHSEHGHTFVGHYNYYVMPAELAKEVREKVPIDIGILVPNGKFLKVVKKPKYRKLDKEMAHDLRMYLIRSMSREVKKSFGSKDNETLSYWKRETAKYKRKSIALHAEMRDLKDEVTRLRRKKK